MMVMVENAPAERDQRLHCRWQDRYRPGRENTDDHGWFVGPAHKDGNLVPRPVMLSRLGGVEAA
jgi:hypothetical protein